MTATKLAVPRAVPAAVLAALLLSPFAAGAADYIAPDPIDRQTLERALFLCQWKTRHDVPDTAPVPAVCKGGAVSTDEAMLQDKQWWTFWARFNSAAALSASQRFSTDFVAFQARLQVKPELADELLPPGVSLPADDWRVKLVRTLKSKARTAKP